METLPKRRYAPFIYVEDLEAEDGDDEHDEGDDGDADCDAH